MMAGTKEKILEAALELFSENGYEAVSVGQLASAVGIKAPSLYKHFSSKQDIYEALFQWVMQQYESRSLFALSGSRDRLLEYEAIAKLSPEEVAERVWRQVKLVTSNPMISKVRKLMTIEQYRNAAFCDMLEKRQYGDVLEYNKGLVQYLIFRGILKEGNAEIMALHLIAPVSLEMQRVDRNPSLEKEAEEMVRQHVVQHFKLYGKNE